MVERPRHLFVHLLTTKIRWLLWRLRGAPALDRHSFAKRAVLAEMGRRHGCTTLVESGTYLGDTVAAMRGRFERIISIKLSQDLHALARRRFQRCADVTLLQGDSGQRLRDALASIQGRALFWLDGHYSGGFTARGVSECPVLDELAAIRTHGRHDHVILIDDARLFGSHPDYPSVDDVRQRLLEINPAYEVTVVDDCIRALPARA